ncbi:hypothetical protein GH714_039877 [Hevea brasiliensis]|uniref:START domain-containing protein n=1 Tax=Hevea brasiliensis TaxID=3981 RepID=A0A6A6KES2_HEVBR|nr:hypothetical protein GH714_039877 [Hevea brasiliensis]
MFFTRLDGHESGCAENVIEKRTTELSNFLDMLRSASVSEHEASKTSQTSHGEWKLKDDKEEYRVMYREGPHGTPLHTLLVEGYVDGPIDTCLCISWESALYKKWDGIPEVKDVVRIDVVGGFAIQKVTSERSTFALNTVTEFLRTIANVDLKLDFVPPSLINFISRQLIGGGFKLYQKAVASVSSYDEDYSKALEDPMYARIRKSLHSTDEANETMEGKELKMMHAFHRKSIL